MRERHDGLYRRLHLIRHVVPGFAHGEHRQQQAGRHVDNAEIERLRPEPVAGSDPTRRQGTPGNSEVSGEFVESHREPPLLRASEVDLHDDCGRPGEPLADPKQYVGGDYPVPVRCPHQHEGDGNGDDPTSEEHLLSAYAVGKPAGEVISQRFGNAEDNDERQDRCACRDMKFSLCNGRQDAALQADHRADEGIDQNQQRELSDVFA